MHDLAPHLIQLPAGFQVSLYASVVDAFFQQIPSVAVMFVETRTAGKIYAGADRDGESRAEQRYWCPMIMLA